MKEIWKDIKGYEGYYQVSNLGRVKGVNRIVKYSDGRIYNYNEKIIAEQSDRNGYALVRLSKNDNQKTHKVHQLVLIAFTGYKPSRYVKVIDHIDGNPKNNRLDNLQVLSNRENVSKGFRNKKTSSTYTGVSWDNERQKYRADINIKGKKKYLGRYNDEYKAHLAYKKALNTLTVE